MRGSERWTLSLRENFIAMEQRIQYEDWRAGAYSGNLEQSINIYFNDCRIRMRAISASLFIWKCMEVKVFILFEQRVAGFSLFYFASFRVLTID